MSNKVMVSCSEDSYMNMFGYYENPKYVDLDGNEVKKNPITNPYDYDEYVEWKCGYEKEDFAVYSDRLMQWDSKKYDKCYKEIFGKKGQSFNKDNPNGIEKFLSMYFGEKVRLTTIMRGCNWLSGFPYWVFFYNKNNN